MPADGRSQEQLLAEIAELRKREQCYRSYIDKGPVAIYVVNAKGRCIDANPAACRQSGYSRSELLGRSISDLAVSADEALEAFDRLVLEGSLETKIRMHKKDGGAFTASMDAVQIAPDSYMAFVADVTELEGQKAALERERKLAQGYLDMVQAMIVVLDVEGNITVINREGCRILGYREDELLGKSWFGHCLPQPEGLTEVYPYFRLLVAGEIEVVEYFENPVCTREGCVREIAWHNTLLYDDRGKIAGTLSAGEDITERKRLEQQVLESKKLEGIGTLAGGLAHDMNNVLAVVLGLAEVSSYQLAEEHPVRAQLGDIIEAAQRGKSLIENLLGFARKGKYEKRALSLNASITKLAAVLKQSLPKNIKVELELDRNLGAIRGDNAQITQTLMNLCMNAADAIADAGTITLTTCNQELAAGEVPQLIAGRYVRVEVRDNGSGMSEEVRAKVTVNIASTLGQGTTVTLWLPLIDSLPESESAPTSEAHPQSAGMANATILVVDDEDLVRKVICKILQTLGYNPIPAIGGRAAIYLYRERGQDIDLVLLDLSMPDMDGAQCFCALREIDPRVPVVLCTGHGEEDKTNELLRQGVIAITRKPFTTNSLTRTLEEALGKDRLSN